MCRPDWARSEPYNRLEKEFRRIQELIYSEMCVWTIHSSNHKNNKGCKVSPQTPAGTEVTNVYVCLAVLFVLSSFLWYSETEHFTGISSQIRDKVCQVPVAWILTVLFTFSAADKTDERRIYYAVNVPVNFTGLLHRLTIQSCAILHALSKKLCSPWPDWSAMVLSTSSCRLSSSLMCTLWMRPAALALEIVWMDVRSQT